jgi:hypothetical protein
MDAYTLTRARQSEDVARQWKAYADELERKLAVCAANLAGMEAMKDAAMVELSRVDPKNYLMVQQNRQRIFDAARAAALDGKRAA